MKTVATTKAAQLELLGGKGKGRGGARIGSGRKAGEGSQVVRVPAGILEEVNKLIDLHKADKAYHITVSEL